MMAEKIMDILKKLSVLVVLLPLSVVSWSTVNVTNLPVPSKNIVGRIINQTSASAAADNIFDGNVATEFKPTSKTEVIYEFATVDTIQSLQHFDSASYILSVAFKNDDGAWQIIPEWTGLDLTGSAAGWQVVTLKNIIKTKQIKLTLEPKSDGAEKKGIKELAFWAQLGSRNVVAGVNTLTQLLNLTVGMQSVQDFGQLYTANATPDIGEIGVSSEQITATQDDVSDNLFKFNVDILPKQITRAWLKYDLYGVSDRTGVAKGINDQLSVGGYLVKTTKEWRQQLEAINPSWLKQGENVIRFTLPEDANYGYKIRNLKLIIEPQVGTEIISSIRASGLSLDEVSRLHDGIISASNAVPLKLLAAKTGTVDAQMQIAFSSNDKVTLCQESLCRESLKTGTVELNLDAQRYVGQVIFHMTALGTGLGLGLSNVIVMGYDNGQWVDLASQRVSMGWNSISLNNKSIQHIRLSFDALPSAMRLSEIQLTANDKMGAMGRTLVISNPSGDYYGNVGYIQGFAQGYGAEGAQVIIGSSTVPSNNGQFEALIQKPTTIQTDVWTAPISVVYPDGAILRQTIVFNASKNTDYERPLQSMGDTIQSGTPSNQKITVLALDTATLEVPNNILSADDKITITALRDMDMPALDMGMVNVTKSTTGARGYRFLPHKGNFNSKIKIRLGFDKTKIPEGSDVKDVKTYFFDESTARWLLLDAKAVVDSENSEIVSETGHFTDMINAVIKTPDSPETQAFNNNSLKDVKAANPAAGIALVDPPTPNSTGDARLSFPIEIPAGRQGMQPQLALTYSSDGGNGWVGMGWGLSIPAISVDTRWGVPRYDVANESELYVMGDNQIKITGGAFNRVNMSIARKPSGTVFFPRVEGSFNRIIRKGDTPKNYVWEVTAKDGTKYFYGGESTVDNSAVMKDDAGNVAYWALVKTVDTNGNFVKYNYATKEDAGVAASTVKGIQLYPSTINYTGSGGVNGKYQVAFTRDTSNRIDKIIDGRYGFKRVVGDRLKKIDVTFSGQPIRQYILDYKYGAFQKTLLDTVTQLDSVGAAVVKPHKFQYWDDARDNTGAYTPFLTSTETNLPDIGVTKSHSSGKGFTFSVGFADGDNACKSSTVGISWDSTKSTNKGRSVLIDVDGDGLTDRVFVDGGQLKYQKNTTNVAVAGNVTYGETKTINGISAFARNETKGHSTGFEITLSAGTCKSAVISGNGSRTKGRSTSNTQIYFDDVNNDGLVDLVDNQKVFFNHLSANGEPTFELTSANTPNPINESAVVGEGDADFGEISEIDKKNNPLNDIVRVWEAPRKLDNITITGTVALQEPQAGQSALWSLQEVEDYVGSKTKDGVFVTIQKNDKIIWKQRIQANNFAEYSHSILENVEKGDRIYFRVESVQDGTFDRVRWSPQIISPDSPVANDSANEDLKARPLGTRIGMPFGGTIKVEYVTAPHNDAPIITSVTSFRPTTDTTTYPDGFIHTPITDLAITINPGDASVTKTATLNVLAKDQIEISANSSYFESGLNPIRDVKISYVSVDNATATSHPTLVPSDLVFYPGYTSNVYTSPTQALTPINFSMAPSGVSVNSVVFNFTPGASSTGTVIAWLYYKGTSDVEKWHRVCSSTYTDGSLTTSDCSGAVAVAGHMSGDKFSAMYTSENRGFLSAAQTATATVNGIPVVPTLKEPHNPAIVTLFGPLHGNWGYFAYNNPVQSNTMDAQFNASLDNCVPTSNTVCTMPVLVSDLHMTTTQRDKIQQVPMTATGSDQEMMDARTNAFESADIPKTEVFMPLSYQGAFNPDQGGKSDGVLQGMDDGVWLSSAHMSSSRYGEDSLMPATIVKTVKGTPDSRGIIKVTNSAETNLTFGVGGSFTFAQGASISANGAVLLVDSTSTTVNDFIDMNGDGYPDIVGTKTIQYTLPSGVLEGAARNIFNDSTSIIRSVSEGNNSSEGVTLGGGITYYAVSAGLNGSFSSGKGQNTLAWRDVNGDGLPDQLNADGTVRLNLGYKFDDPEQWDMMNLFDALQKQKSHSTSIGANAGVNIGFFSMSFGAAISDSTSDTRFMIADMNGDGLADLVNTANSALQVAINTGNGFLNYANWTGGGTSTSKSKTDSTNINGAFTLCKDLLPLAPIKFCGNPKFTSGNSTDETLNSLMDMNGDGFIDTLSDSNVYLSKINRTNLLKSMERPLGATVNLNYSRIGNTYDLPQNKWVLSLVEIIDGVADDGADKQQMQYIYKNPKYDRREREFYGFGRVEIEQKETVTP